MEGFCVILLVNGSKVSLIDWDIVIHFKQRCGWFQTIGFYMFRSGEWLIGNYHLDKQFSHESMRLHLDAKYWGGLLVSNKDHDGQSSLCILSRW